jgi:hypothetical protein
MSANGCQRDQRQQRAENDEPGNAGDEAQRARQAGVPARPAQAARGQPLAGIDELDRDLAGQMLVELDAVFDDHAAQPERQQPVHRQAAAALGRGQHDRRGAGLLEQPGQVLRGAEHGISAELGGRIGVLGDDADNLMTGARLALDRVDQVAGKLAGAEHQRADARFRA